MGADSTGSVGATAAPRIRQGSTGRPSVTAPTSAPASVISSIPGSSATAKPRQLPRSQCRGSRMAAAVTAMASVTRAASRRISACSGSAAGSRRSRPKPRGPRATPASTQASGSDTHSSSFTTPVVAPNATSRPKVHSTTSQMSGVMAPRPGMGLPPGRSCRRSPAEVQRARTDPAAGDDGQGAVGFQHHGRNALRPGLAVRSQGGLHLRPCHALGS